MTKHRHRKKERPRRSPLEECYGRWRVDPRPLLRVLSRLWPSAVERVREELRSLEAALNSEEQAIHRLLRESVVAETPMGPVRRYRISTPAGWLRLLFIVDIKACTVIFTDAELRDEETYKRIKRRRG